jgi:hypothetical protein
LRAFSRCRLSQLPATLTSGLSWQGHGSGTKRPTAAARHAAEPLQS